MVCSKCSIESKSAFDHTKSFFCVLCYEERQVFSVDLFLLCFLSLMVVGICKAFILLIRSAGRYFQEIYSCYSVMERGGFLKKYFYIFLLYRDTATFMSSHCYLWLRETAIVTRLFLLTN